MAKTKDKLLDKAGGARPYLERAMTDEDLRQNVRNAFESAREVYNELIGGRGAIALGTRVATDREIQDRLKEAIDELREAADRVQGRSPSRARCAASQPPAASARHFTSSLSARRASARTTGGRLTGRRRARRL